MWHARSASPHAARDELECVTNQCGAVRSARPLQEYGGRCEAARPRRLLELHGLLASDQEGRAHVRGPTRSGQGELDGANDDVE
eukprot:5530841-Prymnesium_polylepis.1